MSKRKAETPDPAVTRKLPRGLVPQDLFEFGEAYDGSSFDYITWHQCKLLVDLGPLKAETEIDSLTLDPEAGSLVVIVVGKGTQEKPETRLDIKLTITSVEVVQLND